MAIPWGCHSSCSSWGPSVVCWSIKPANCRYTLEKSNINSGYRIPSGNETWQKIPVKISINGGQPSKKSSMFQQTMFDDTGLQNQAELITRGYSHCSCGPQHGILWNRRFPCSILYLWDPCWLKSKAKVPTVQHKTGSFHECCETNTATLKAGSVWLGVSHWDIPKPLVSSWTNW